MSDPQYYHAGEASIWAQPDGPNTEVFYLGCHELMKLEVPEGDLTPRFCPDPAQSGKFKIRRIVRGAPDLPTAEIVLPIGRTLDYLESWDCPGTLFINKQSCGRRDLFTNYERSFILRQAEKTGRTYDNLASRTPDNTDDSTVTVPIGFVALSQAALLESFRRSVSSTDDLLTIAFVDDSICANCGPKVVRGQYGITGGAPGLYATADLEFTDDSGATWTPSAANPFGATQSIGASVYFPYTSGVRRAIVGLSTTDPASEMKIAYSDDAGVSWTVVLVGSTHAEFVTAMFAIDRNNIWLTSNLGSIWKSVDAGVTWVEQEASVITATDYLVIQFVDTRLGFAAGETNIIAVTANGGLSWAALAGPAAQAAVNITALYAISSDVIWLGYSDGELWYTMNGGLNWYQRAFSGSGAGKVVSIGFVNESVGFMLHNTAAPEATILRTRDGGYSWEPTALPTNDGATAMWVDDENRAIVVGFTTGGTALMAEVTNA